MAYQPMFSTGGGFNPMSLYESDEERRRREEEEARLRGELPAGPVAPAEPGPVKQTITYDPVTGQQRMKIEGSVQDLSPANPLTPTINMPGTVTTPTNVAGPMAPGAGPTQDEILRDQEQARLQQLMMAQPVSPTAPAPAVAEPATQPPIQMAAAPAMTQTDVTAPMMAAPEPLGTGIGRPGMAAETGPMNYNNILVAASRDPNALMRVAQQAGGQWGKVFAGEAKEKLEDQRNQEAGQTRAQRALETGIGGKRILQRESEPGSIGFYAKMWFMRGVGLEKEANDELAKNTFTYQNITGPNGEAYTIKMRGDGLALAAYDQNGNQVDDKTLSSLASQATVMKGAQVGTSTFTDPVTRETLTKVDTQQGPIWYNKSRQRVIPKGEPIPNTAGSNIDLQAKLADIRIVESIIRKGVNNIQDAKAEYVSRKGPFGSATNSLTEQDFDSYFAGQLNMLRNPPSVSGTGITAPAAQAPAAQPVAQPAVPVAPTSPAAAPRTSVTPPAAVAQPPAAPVTGPVGRGFETKPQTEIATQLTLEKGKPPAKAEGEMKAKDIKNQNMADSTYSLIQPMADLIKQSTGSGIGTKVDQLASQFGIGTQGQQAISQLNVLTYAIVSNVPRFEGPQGVRDVELYERAAGDLNNSKKPIKERLAALQAIVKMLEKYDKAGKNDWTFGETSDIRRRADEILKGR